MVPLHLPHRDRVGIGISDIDELIENIIIDNKQHRGVIQIILNGEEPLRGIISIYKMHLSGVGDLAIDLAIRFKRDAAMEEDLEIGPCIGDLIDTSESHHLLDDREEPGRDTRDIGDIGISGGTHQSREFILPIGEKSRLLVGEAEKIGKRIDAVDERSAEIADMYIRVGDTELIGERATEHERLSGENARLRVGTKVMRHAIGGTGIMTAIKAIMGDRDKLGAIAGST